MCHLADGTSDMASGERDAEAVNMKKKQKVGQEKGCSWPMVMHQ